MPALIIVVSAVVAAALAWILIKLGVWIHQRFEFPYALWPLDEAHGCGAIFVPTLALLLLCLPGMVAMQLFGYPEQVIVEVMCSAVRIGFSLGCAIWAVGFLSACIPRRRK